MPSKPRDPLSLKHARELRRVMTPEERRLWYLFLRGLPVRFRRQEPIGPYIADFYCASAHLIIELDGSQHFEPDAMAYDAARTAFFAAQGLRVLRFTNADVNQRFQSVCASIHHALSESNAQ